jgi:hypothetical protein
MRPKPPLSEEELNLLSHLKTEGIRSVAQKNREVVNKVSLCSPLHPSSVSSLSVRSPQRYPLSLRPTCWLSPLGSLEIRREGRLSRSLCVALE